jgi:hypothetical protein
MVMEIFKLLDSNTSDSGSYHITMNDHKSCHRTVEQELECLPDLYDFVSEEDKTKCIETNTLYSLHWYQDTQVGFIKLNGSSIEVVYNQLVEYLNE